jgi:hypothetical protein
MTPEESKVEEVRDIRAELKALSSLGIWDQFAEECSEETMIKRRRWAYLDDRLNLLNNPETNPRLSVVLKGEGVLW